MNQKRSTMKALAVYRGVTMDTLVIMFLVVIAGIVLKVIADDLSVQR